MHLVSMCFLRGLYAPNCRCPSRWLGVFIWFAEFSGSVPVTSETLMQRHWLISPAVILNPSYGFERLPNGFHDLLLSSPAVSEVWPSGTARAFEVARLSTASPAFALREVWERSVGHVGDRLSG